MASVQSPEQKQQRIDLGQRLFMLGVFAIMTVEILGTVVNMGHGFTWPGFIFGVLSAVVIIYLGNRLYSGDKPALPLMRLWVALQVMVIGGALLWMWQFPPGDARLVGVTSLWLGLLKLAVYLMFATWLFCPGAVVDFLASARGETPADPVAAADETAADTPAELTAAQAAPLEGLGSTMNIAGWAGLIVGFLLVFFLSAGSSYGPGERSAAAMASWWSGLFLMVVSSSVFATVKVVQTLSGAAQRSMSHVMRVFAQLQMLFVVQIGAVLVLTVAALWPLLRQWLPQ